VRDIAAGSVYSRAMVGCLSDDDAAALVAGDLDPRIRRELNLHLDDCARCRRLVSALVASDVRTTDEHGGGQVELAAGQRLGRFELVKELGAGSMGAVWAARDPELDRAVAVKLLRLWPGAIDADAAARMRREAQAMARLNHANVVRIYELGTDGDRVFCAMELVAGDTLRAWLAAPRTPAEILEVAIAIGRGVAAAHAAGLIHRDIKPENVLMAADGRPLVSDFGLAKLTELAPNARSAADAAPGAFHDLIPQSYEVALPFTEPDLPGLTVTGGVVGTPAYMPPEQLAAGAVDARSDQFSYCVLVWEALFGRRPFEAARLDELAPAIARGPRPARRRGVPRGVVRALERGLASDPAARWPTMQALVDALDRQARRPRRLLVAAGGALAVGALALALSGARTDRCAAGAGLIDPIWNPGAHAATAARFVQLAPDAGVGATSALRLVDDWAAAWKLGRQAACTVDEPARAGRIACLDRGLQDLRAQLAVWRTADRGVVDAAVRAAAELPDATACATSRAGRGNPILGELIGQVDALVRSGRAPEARAQVPALLALAEGADPRDLALALTSAGRAEHATSELTAARDHLARAAREAGRAGDDPALLAALLEEATVIIRLGQPLVALGVIDAARALDERTGARSNDAVLAVRASALQQAGRPEEAIATLRAVLPAVEARAARDARDRRLLGSLLATLASALRQHEDYQGSRATVVRMLALDEEALGPSHPQIAEDLLQLTACERRLRRFTDAKAHLARARAIAANVFGERGLLLGSIDLMDAEIAEFENRDDDAHRHLLHARDAFATVLPPDHQRFSVVELGLGELERARDNCKAALPHLERAIHIVEVSGHDPRDHAQYLVDLGACQIDVGRIDEGKNTMLRAISELDDLHMAGRWYSEPYAALADLEFAAGRPAAAIELEEKALAAIAEDKDPDAVPLRAYEHQQLELFQKALAK
jgi:tetratricopeptide (TPR) repeat protein